MKRIMIAWLCFCLLLGFSACGAEKTQKDDESVNASDPIVVGILPDTQSVPIIVAKHMGYFDDENVKVDIESFTSAADRDSAIQSGSVNTVISDLIAVALFRQSGLDIQAILSTDGSQQILAASDSGITSIEGLAGKTVALSENTIMDYATDRILAYYGVDKDSVEYSYVPQMTVRMEMLINNNVDAATMPEPQVSVAKASGATVLASSADLGLNATCLAMFRKTAEAQPDAVKAFIRAYNKAVVYLNDTPAEEYMDWVISETGFPESVSDTLTLPDYREATAPAEADVTDVMDWMMERGLLEKALDYDDMVNSEFAR